MLRAERILYLVLTVVNGISLTAATLSLYLGEGVHPLRALCLLLAFCWSLVLFCETFEYEEVDLIETED